jgi:hypothetical protein
MQGQIGDPASLETVAAHEVHRSSRIATSSKRLGNRMAAMKVKA